MRCPPWALSACLSLLACTDARTPAGQSAETLRTSGACEDGLCDASGPNAGEPASSSDDDAGFDDLYWQSGASGGALVEAGTINRCVADDITMHLIAADSWGVCPGEPGRPATDCATAIRNTMRERQPFEVYWTTGNPDVVYTNGFVGVLTPGGHDVYQVHVSSLPFETPFDPAHTWRAAWTRCVTFSIAEDCSNLRDCFKCVRDETSLCGCGRPESPSTIVCVDSSG